MVRVKPSTVGQPTFSLHSRRSGKKKRQGNPEITQDQKRGRHQQEITKPRTVTFIPVPHFILKKKNKENINRNLILYMISEDTYMSI